MLQRFYLLAVTTVLVLSAGLRAETSLWKQPIRTEEDRVKFLLHMEKEIPGLFDGMTDFDTDLFQTLIWQQKFVDEVASQPENFSWAQKDPQLKKYKIRLLQHDTSKKGGAVMDSTALSYLKADIKAGLAQLSGEGEHDLRGAVKAKLLEISKLESGKVFDSAAADFRDLIPKSEQKNFLPLSPQAKMDYLIHQFLPTVTIDREKVVAKIDQLSRVLARDRKIKELAAVAVALGNSEEVVDAKTLKSELDSMDLAVRFGTPEKVRTSLEKMLDSQEPGTQPISMAERKNKFNLAKGTLSEHTSKFKDFAERKPQLIQEVTVTEVPATHGVMRGCVGNDCASKNLVGYSNLPDSRVIFIDTGKGVPSGYGEYAFVNSGKEGRTRSQYFPVFNGKALSGDVVDLVVRGLDAVKKQRGVDNTLVLRPDQLKYNVNYDIIRDAFSRMMGKDSVPIQFEDADVRRAAKPYVAVDNYHSPDKIKTALPYSPKPLASGQTIEVSAEDTQLPQLDLTQPVDKGAALRVALELEAATEKPKYSEIQLKNLDKKQEHVDYDHNARLELRNAFLRAAHIPVEKFEETLDVLANKEHLPVDEYLKKASEWLKGMGYEFDPNFKKTRIEPYLLGLYRAPDAFESKYKDKLVSGAIWLLQKGKHQEDVAAVVAKNPELFKNNVRLGNILLDLARFENTKLYYPAWEMAETLGRGGYNGESKPELIETLLVKMNQQKDFYHRKAAAGMLIKLNSHLKEAVRALKEMQRTEGHDAELGVLLAEAKHRLGSGGAPKSDCASSLGKLH
jgi:hypothetical protein